MPMLVGHLPGIASAGAFSTKLLLGNFTQCCSRSAKLACNVMLRVFGCAGTCSVIRLRCLEQLPPLQWTARPLMQLCWHSTAQSLRYGVLDTSNLGTKNVSFVAWAQQQQQQQQ
jgi:hypothetical protein